MTDQHQGDWHYLEAEVDGQVQYYQLDTSRLSGGEAELIEDRTGISLTAWGHRIQTQRWAKDLNLLLFIAASRDQVQRFGTSELDYRAFIDRVQLTSVRELDGPPDPASAETTEAAPKANRSTRRSTPKKAADSATSSG